MDEKVKDQDVLLVKEKSSGELKVVTGIEKDGKPKAVEAKPENEPSRRSFLAAGYGDAQLLEFAGQPAWRLIRKTAAAKAGG